MMHEKKKKDERIPFLLLVPAAALPPAGNLKLVATVSNATNPTKCSLWCKEVGREVSSRILSCFFSTIPLLSMSIMTSSREHKEAVSMNSTKHRFQSSTILKDNPENDRKNDGTFKIYCYTH